MTNPLLAALALARRRAAPLFSRWCEREESIFCPAPPAAVACFVKQHSGLGITQLWPALQDVSKLHVSLGLADPTLAAPVTAAVSDITGIVPPRTWPADWKQRFRILPYDLQVFIAEHEVRRDRALRRSQNDAAAARQRQVHLQQEAAEHKEGCK